MLVLITYDVNTETAAGRKRLRKVAKKCVDHGQRVQNSVFECLLDAAQFAVLKSELAALIDPDFINWATTIRPRSSISGCIPCLNPETC